MSNSRLPELSRLESLETREWPAHERILSFLRTDAEWSDLANLSKVSTHFRRCVFEFMKKGIYRPGIKELELYRAEEGLIVEIRLFVSNIPFQDLSILKSDRFSRSMVGTSLAAQALLKGKEDPILEGVTALLSTSIQSLCVVAFTGPSSPVFALSAQLLRASTIRDLSLNFGVLDNSNAYCVITIRSSSPYSLVPGMISAFICTGNKGIPILLHSSLIW
ncbi:hypothetical protein PMAYCL1PPCAC_10599, partial [Pristionchus mayeri]